MPLTTLSDLERRLRKLEMLYDQDRHKISPPDRNVNTSHPLDVPTTAKAADSELLDGINSTGFVQTSGDQTIGGVKTFSSLPTLPAGIPTANQPVRKGYADLAYLSILATAQNSDKLDNLDSTDFALAGHDHNAAYLGISAKAADSDKLDGLDSTDFVKNSALGVWNNWTPTQTGWTALPSGTYRYCAIGKLCIFIIDITAGTSNSIYAQLSLPFTVKTGTYYGGVNGMAMDNGTVLQVPTKWYIDTPNSTITFGTNMGTGLWTASGTKRIRCEGFYEIA